MDVTFHEHVSYFTRPQLQGESSDSNSNLESEFELEFLFLGPWLCDSPPVSDSLSPGPDPPDPLGGPVPSPSVPPVSPMSSVLQETTPLAPVKNKASEPMLTYQRKGKPSLVQKQLQPSEPEVSTENDPSTSDSQISDTLDHDLDNLPITLRKGKRSCAKYPISQFVSSEIFPCSIRVLLQLLTL